MTSNSTRTAKYEQHWSCTLVIFCIAIFAIITPVHAGDTFGRGDINVNGIQYEDADLELFSRYFVYGLGVFNVNIQGQIAETDVNEDGLTLQLRDLAFLHRIMIGDTFGSPPPPPAAADTAHIVLDLLHKTVSITSPQPLTMLIFSYSGDSLNPTWGFATPMKILRFEGFNNDMHCFLFPENDSAIDSGQLFSYTGSPAFTFGVAVDWHDADVPVVFTTVGAPPECGDFNASGSVSVTDLTFMVSYLFNGGPIPMDAGDGDINCNGMATITDLVVLVRYLFNSGPAPCCLNK